MRQTFFFLKFRFKDVQSKHLNNHLEFFCFKSSIRKLSFLCKIYSTQKVRNTRVSWTLTLIKQFFQKEIYPNFTFFCLTPILQPNSNHLALLQIEFVCQKWKKLYFEKTFDKIYLYIKSLKEARYS